MYMHVNQFSSDRLKDINKKIFIDKVLNRCRELNYTILKNYVNNKTKICLKCNIHNFIWNPLPSNFLKGSKCPVCSNSYLDNDIIDDRIKERNIKRVSNFKKSTEKMMWKCLVDGYEWEATSHNILDRHTGCPKCTGQIKLTNEIIDEKIKNKSIIRIGNVVGNSRTKIEWQCKVDGHRWFSSPNSICNNDNQCPKCSGWERITDKIIDERIKNREDIVRIGSIDGKNSSDKIRWKCKKCDNEWLAQTNSILSRGDGCPECKWMKTEKELYKLIKNLNIECLRQKRIDYENRRMFVDFMLNNSVLLEYNGKQHYMPVRFGGCSIKEAEKRFKNQIDRDNRLKKYCRENNIKLIEIPYYEKKENWESIIMSGIGVKI